jgi:hypothetical protein
MTDAHEAVQSLSPQEAFEIFKALFKDAPFMGTAILSKNQEYTVDQKRPVLLGGEKTETVTSNFAVVFLDETNEHFQELRQNLTAPCRVTGIKEEDLDKVTLPQGCKKVITITAKDGKTWHLYQGPNQIPTSHTLPRSQQELTRNFFLLTAEGLRETIANQIFRAQRDLESLRENMSVNNVDKVQKRLEQLAELPDDLLTEELRVLRTVLSSDPEYLNRVKKLLEEAQGLLSPEALEKACANMATQGGRSETTL